MAVWCWGLNCCGELGPRQDCQEQGRGEKAAAEKVKKIKNDVTRPSKLCKYLILNFGHGLCPLERVVVKKFVQKA